MLPVKIGGVLNGDRVRVRERSLHTSFMFQTGVLVGVKIGNEASQWVFI